MAEENKKYTSQDFKRYHDGSMPPKEMHALERAALEDPFLADALEGFTYAPDFTGDIAELKSRLEEKRKRRNVFTISAVTQNTWWRIAALFVIITGAILIFYLTNSNKREDSLANIQAPVSKNNSDSVAAIADSTSISGDVAMQNSPAPGAVQKNEMESPERDELMTVPERQKTKRAAESKGESSADDVAIADEAIPDGSKAFAEQARGQYSLKGKITNDQGQPIPNATIADDSRRRATITDSSGNFALASPDSNLVATVSATGYASKKAPLQKDKEQTIAMNKADADLTETISGYTKKKKETDTKKATDELSGKVAGVEINNSSLQPFPANKEFQDYLSTNIQPVFDDNNQHQQGEITLSFTIDKKGRPTNIIVKNSTCSACEEQAKSLLANGPRWKDHSEKSGTVTINFKDSK